MERNDSVKSSAQHTSPAATVRRRWAWLLVALGAATAVWLLWQNKTVTAPEQLKRVTGRSLQTAPLVTARSVQVASNRHVPLAAAAPRSVTENEHILATADGVDDDHERPHPHPIDPTRQRIYRENNLNGAMMGAMNIGDYLGLRALIEEYRLAYPEDEYRLQEGYSLVADCLERLTTERQHEAREYWRNNRGSLVRRFIRRHCLEQPVVDG